MKKKKAIGAKPMAFLNKRLYHDTAVDREDLSRDHLCFSKVQNSIGYLLWSHEPS